MKNSRGFSLIEVLITLVLTVIGVLGMVAMQTKAIQYTAESVTRSTAVMLVDDMLELLRSNRDKIYNKKSELIVDSKYFKKEGESFPVLNCNAYDSLTSAEDPETQLCVWAQHAKALLPGVTDEVLKSNFYIEQVDSTNAIELGVFWVGKADECGEDLCTYSVVVEI